MRNFNKKSKLSNNFIKKIEKSWKFYWTNLKAINIRNKFTKKFVLVLHLKFRVLSYVTVIKFYSDFSKHSLRFSSLEGKGGRRGAVDPIFNLGTWIFSASLLCVRWEKRHRHRWLFKVVKLFHDIFAFWALPILRHRYWIKTGQ